MVDRKIINLVDKAAERQLIKLLDRNAHFFFLRNLDEMLSYEVTDPKEILLASKVGDLALSDEVLNKVVVLFGISSNEALLSKLKVAIVKCTLYVISRFYSNLNENENELLVEGWLIDKFRERLYDDTNLLLIIRSVEEQILLRWQIILSVKDT